MTPRRLKSSMRSDDFVSNDFDEELLPNSFKKNNPNKVSRLRFDP